MPLAEHPKPNQACRKKGKAPQKAKMHLSISTDFQDSKSMIPTANCTKEVIVRPISVNSSHQGEATSGTQNPNRKESANSKSLIVGNLINLISSYIYLSIDLSIYLSTYLSIHPSIHPSIYQYIRLSIHPSIQLSLHMYMICTCRSVHCICALIMSIDLLSCRHNQSVKKGQTRSALEGKRDSALHEAFGSCLLPGKLACLLLGLLVIPSA